MRFPPPADLFRHLPQASGLLQRVGWAAAGHAGTQIIRFGANLVLTRLLAPELFGIMVLLTSIRVGLELFTDIGIGQNIIASPEATNERFYNTAWTVQVIRGGLLVLLSLLLLPLLRSFYDQPQLNQLLPFISVFFLVTGFNSVGLPLAIKALDTKRVAGFEVASAFLGTFLLIVAAAASPNIWGLLGGNILSVLATTIISYCVKPDFRPRFVLDRRHVREIVGLGKWIFISSVVYFLAMNFDRLILAKYVSFTALGLYGLARSLGDVASQFAAKLGTAIIFPGVASSGLDGDELRSKIKIRRRQFLIAALIVMAGLIAGSDLIIKLLYDERYAGAATLLPWIGIAAWLGILNTLNESVLLGLRRPAYMAFGNAAKFSFVLVLLPWAVIHIGVVGAAIATLIGDLARYVALSVGKFREDVGFLKQDLAATMLLVILVISLNFALQAVGLSGSLGEMLRFA